MSWPRPNYRNHFDFSLASPITLRHWLNVSLVGVPLGLRAKPRDLLLADHVYGDIDGIRDALRALRGHRP